jgi:hypothetical protein
MKKKLFVSLLFFLVSTSARAEFSGDAYVAGVSKYLWRGQQLYNNIAVQPGFDLNYDALSLGFWGSYSAADNTFAEADFTPSYLITLNDKFDLRIGYTFYNFPQPDYTTSHEAFVAINYKGFLSPSLKAYYDFGNGDGFYAELGASYTFANSIKDITLGSTLGFNAGQWGYDTSLTVLGVNLTTTFNAGPVAIAPLVFAQIALDDQYKHGNTFDGFGGLTVTYLF